MRRLRLCAFVVALVVAGGAKPVMAGARRGPLDPRGTIHVPIGIPNTLDTLKTFVEAEGCFSPGVGSYGIYFWLYDRAAKKLVAPTMDGVPCEHGLAGRGYLIPWSRWRSGPVTVRTEVCEVRRPSPAGDVFVVGARVHLTNGADEPGTVSLVAALRPLGPAGWPVAKLDISERGDALLVDGHPALVANAQPSGAGVLPADEISSHALAGTLPGGRSATSIKGDCSGALRFDLSLEPGKTTTLGFVCPVLPGRRAIGHRWDGVSQWAQFDLAKPNPAEGGILQPDPGIDCYRAIQADTLFDEAMAYWKGLAGRVRVELPDRRWAEAMNAILGHAAMAMNEGAPDVAVVNYNVFNRDGVYTTNILQKAGCPGLAAEAIDYFLRHPFNGRVYPEADNPGQILWVMGEHWRFTRDRAWLERVYPAVQKLVALIRYYRTTPEPHWVALDSLDFGDALPEETRQRLQPGRCDGRHPEYTQAFDIAGMRAAALLAEAAKAKQDIAAWRPLADRLFQSYEQQFAKRLPKAYGSYCVLWPCRLFPLGEGPAFEQFRRTGVQKPTGWRYFPLARAHQGLLAGRRDAGHATIDRHLAHPQMRGWYAFDEGGKSGAGGWEHLRTTWNPSVAMPHGWAIAELWLLLRDSLALEDDGRLILFAGLPPAWLTGDTPIEIAGLPTWFGKLSVTWKAAEGGATVQLGGDADPPGGFVLRLHGEMKASVDGEGEVRSQAGNTDIHLPRGTREARLRFEPKP